MVIFKIQTCPNHNITDVGLFNILLDCPLFFIQYVQVAH